VRAAAPGSPVRRRSGRSGKSSACPPIWVSMPIIPTPSRVYGQSWTLTRVRPRLTKPA
jgi:hypothetical protein